VGENRVVPERTRQFFPRYPGLTSWADIISPLRGFSFARSLPCSNLERVLIHSFNARTSRTAHFSATQTKPKLKRSIPLTPHLPSESALRLRPCASSVRRPLVPALWQEKLHCSTAQLRASTP